MLLICSPCLFFRTPSKAEVRRGMIACHSLSEFLQKRHFLFLFFFTPSVMCLLRNTNDFLLVIHIYKVSDQSLMSSVVFAFYHIILNSAKFTTAWNDDWFFGRFLEVQGFVKNFCNNSRPDCVNSTWPILSESPDNKVVTNCDSSNHLSPKTPNTWDFHLFFVTTICAVNHHRLIDSKITLVSVIKSFY